MKRKRYSDEEKAVLIKKLLSGESISSVSQETGVNSVLLSRWRKEYRENGRFSHRQTRNSDAVVTFKKAQTEIKHLRKQLENKTLEIMVLRDMLRTTRPTTGELIQMVLKWHCMGYEIKRVCKIVGLSRREPPRYQRLNKSFCH